MTAGAELGVGDSDAAMGGHRLAAAVVVAVEVGVKLGVGDVLGLLEGVCEADDVGVAVAVVVGVTLGVGEGVGVALTSGSKDQRKLAPGSTTAASSVPFLAPAK